MTKWVVGLLGLILGVGIMYSMWDYRQWQKIDRGNFGQGNPEEQQFMPAQALDRPVSLLNVLRLKPPLDWVLTRNPYFENQKGYPPIPATQTEVGRFNHPANRTVIRVLGEKYLGDEPTFTSDEAAAMTRDRLYITTESGTWEVGTWEQADQVKQRAVLVHDAIRWEIEATYSGADWQTWMKTYESVVESAVWL